MVRALLLEDADQLEYQAILGLVYLKKGQIGAAFDALYRIAQAWHSQGRFDEASELIDAYLRAEPDDSDFPQPKVRVTQEPAAATAEPPDLPVIPAGVEKPAFLEVEPAAALAETVLPPATAGIPAGGLEPDVEALFQESRKGGKAPVGGDKYETHYDLGVAYKEMGLLTEAIEEFQRAARGPTRFVDACTMIAACYKVQRLNTTAVGMLERVLADARCAGAGGPYVKYDLAVLYEEGGLTDKAARLLSGIPSAFDGHGRLVRLPGGLLPARHSPAQTTRPASLL